jgi:hypothetical protein
MGKNMRAALDFIRRVNGWHGYDKRDRSVVYAVNALARIGLVEINEFAQFRALPVDAPAELPKS